MKVVSVSAFGGVEKFVAAGEKNLYVGRPSLLGNPFKLGVDGDRQEVLAKYRAWLWSEVQANSEVAQAIRALPEDAVLGCWCVSCSNLGEEVCHAQVIAKCWRWMHGRS